MTCVTHDWVVMGVLRGAGMDEVHMACSVCGLLKRQQAIHAALQSAPIFPAGTLPAASAAPPPSNKIEVRTLTDFELERVGTMSKAEQHSVPHDCDDARRIEWMEGSATTGAMEAGLYMEGGWPGHPGSWFVHWEDEGYWIAARWEAARNGYNEQKCGRELRDALDFARGKLCA